MRRVWIGVTLVALIALSALIGLIIANGPEYLHHFQTRR